MDFRPGSENRKVLNQDFYHEQYTEFRTWYFTSHTSDQLQNFKIQYYEYLGKHQIIQPFPLWFQNQGYLPDSQLNVLENI